MVCNIYSKFEKQKARSLRESGKSLREISLLTNVPKSTVRSWVKDVPLSPTHARHLYTSKIEAMKQAPNSAHKKKLVDIERIKKEAVGEYEVADNREYLTAGVMLYWAEGDKNKNTSFTNSDAKMMKFIVDWFQEVCKVETQNLEARLHIHNRILEKKAINYWSDLLSIPKQNFRRSYVKKHGTGHRKNALPNGIIRVRVSGIGNTQLRRKILFWSELIAEKYNRP